MPRAMDNHAALDLLEAMVRIQSLSGAEGDLAAFLVGRMQELGFEAQVDDAGNAVGVIGAGPLTVVLLGHMDTVPGDIPVRVENNQLYGRGTVDAKGPLAAFIAAAARLGQSDLPLRLIVIGCVEEEVPSSRRSFCFAALPTRLLHRGRAERLERYHPWLQRRLANCFAG